MGEDYDYWDGPARVAKPIAPLTGTPTSIDEAQVRAEARKEFAEEVAVALEGRALVRAPSLHMDYLRGVADAIRTVREVRDW